MSKRRRKDRWDVDTVVIPKETMAQLVAMSAYNGDDEVTGKQCQKCWNAVERCTCDDRCGACHRLVSECICGDDDGAVASW